MREREKEREREGEKVRERGTRHDSIISGGAESRGSDEIIVLSERNGTDARRVAPKAYRAQRKRAKNKSLFSAISQVFGGTFGQFGHVCEHPDRGSRQV